MKNNITKKYSWKTCDDVPCGESMPQYTPKYIKTFTREYTSCM